MNSTRPYSIRDLRTVFKGDTLIRSFGGEYDYTDRRWRFSSREAAREARAFLAEVRIYTLHDPEAVRKADVIKRHRGIALDSSGAFSVVARNDEGGNRRGTGFFIFSDESHRFEAQRQVYLFVRAAKAQVDVARELLRGAPEDFRLDGKGPSALRDELNDRAPHRHDVFRIIARLTTTNATYPPNDAARAESIDEVLRHARALEPDFTPEPCRRPARVAGLLLGRSAHHYAIQLEDDGRGVILDRWKIGHYVARHASTDLAVREAGLETRRAIGIDLDAHGFGEAVQVYTARHGSADPRYDGDNTDLYVGRLRVAGMLAARDAGVLPILHHETFDPREDIDATIVASDETLSLALDDGAYTIIGQTDLFFSRQSPQPTIRRGPSFPAPRTLARSR
jgi:hypothetical protein